MNNVPVFDEPSEVRARGARVRHEDCCGGGADTSAHLEEVRRAADDPHVYAVKLYPAGATTNSDAGIHSLEATFPVLEEMAGLERVKKV